MASPLVGSRHPRSHALSLAAARRDPLSTDFRPESVRNDPLLNAQLSSMDGSVSACLQRAGHKKSGDAIRPEMGAQLGDLGEKVDSLLLPWEHSLVAPRLDSKAFGDDPRWMPSQAAGMPSTHLGFNAGFDAMTRSPSAPSLGPRMQISSPPKLRGRRPPPRIMAWPDGGQNDNNKIFQRTLVGLESTDVSKGVLIERVLDGVEAGEMDAREGLGALESGLLERLIPKGAAAVRMGLEEVIDDMLERPSPKRDVHHQVAPVVPRGEFGCQKCGVLSQQVAALGQALTGFCSLAYHWSAGLPAVRRQGIAQLALEYAGPCAHIYADLAQVCVELEQARWGDKPPNPQKRPQGTSKAGPQKPETTNISDKSTSIARSGVDTSALGSTVVNASAQPYQFSVDVTPEIASLGFGVHLPPGNVVITNIEANMWGEQIGLQVDDEIITANGHEAQYVTADDFIAILKSRPLNLVLVRYSEEIGEETVRRPDLHHDWWDDEPVSPRMIPEAEGPRLVGNYGATRHDGTVPFFVDNSILRATSSGLGYRKSPDLQDRDGKAFAKWGTVVYGTSVGNDWIRVEGRYLPRVVNGIEVLIAQG